MKQYWQDANGEKMRSSSKSSDVVISGNPGIMSPVELDIAGVTSRD